MCSFICCGELQTVFNSILVSLNLSPSGWYIAVFYHGFYLKSYDSGWYHFHALILVRIAALVNPYAFIIVSVFSYEL